MDVFSLTSMQFMLCSIRWPRFPPSLIPRIDIAYVKFGLTMYLVGAMGEKRHSRLNLHTAAPALLCYRGEGNTWQEIKKQQNHGARPQKEKKSLAFQILWGAQIMGKLSG